MAGRIRTVKPELIAQIKFAELSDGAARLFYGLKALVDDCGRCPAGASYLHGQIFYAQKRSAASVAKLRAELEAAGWVFCYTAKVDQTSRTGGEYLEIVGWADKGSVTYQRVEKHQGARYPAPESNRSGNGSGNDSVTEPEPEPESESEREPEPDRESDADRARSAGLAEAAGRVAPTGWEPAATEENVEAADAVIARGGDLDESLQRFRRETDEEKITDRQRNTRWRGWLKREATGKHSPEPDDAFSYEPRCEADGSVVMAELLGATCVNRYVVREPNGLFRGVSQRELEAALAVEKSRRKAS